ncbi:PP2C family protein-serine/threonine phosphatase [Kineococcus sp. SYSU DK003]|uniref:PP2C family protein-serine/threonine phosphatase n=1 Tax=Kineococcus sp. SYSU DK003 TaxID=3383124 RepID=UPI003D7EC1AB
MSSLSAAARAWHRLMTRTSLQRRVSVMGLSFLVVVLVLTVVLFVSMLGSTRADNAADSLNPQRDLLGHVEQMQQDVVVVESTHELYVTAADLERLERYGTARTEAMAAYDASRRQLVADVRDADPPLEEELRDQVTRALDAAARWRSLSDQQAGFKARAQGAELNESVVNGPVDEAFLQMYGQLGTLQEQLADARDDALEEARQDAVQTRNVQFVVAAIALLLVPAALYLVRRWVIHPLGSLSEQLLRVAGGDLQTPVSLPGPPELADVAASAETMRRRILDELADAVSAREALQQGQPLVAEVRDQLTAHDLPVVPGWSAAAALRPAEGLLAGDWYDVLPLPDGRFAVVVADVSGHGARAGIVAIQLKRLLEAALHLAPEPDLALAMAARVFSDEAERFASCVVAVVDPDSGTVTYANAGHPAPLVLRHDEGQELRVVTELEPTGPLLSWLHLDVPGAWRTATASMAPGSLLVVFTDGLTEARSTGSTEELGIGGVLRALGGLPELTPQALVDLALDEARRFSGGRARDDVTLVALARGATPLSAPARDAARESTRNGAQSSRT